MWQDDDGQAYHVCARKPDFVLHIAPLRVAPLREDYLGVAGKYRALSLGEHFEAPALCKRAGRYSSSQS